MRTTSRRRSLMTLGAVGAAVALTAACTGAPPPSSNTGSATAQTSGFTLDEISELLELDQSDDRPRVRALARQRIEVLDEKISQMTETRAALARLADQCAKSDKGPCPILAAFDPA